MCYGCMQEENGMDPNSVGRSNLATQLDMPPSLPKWANVKDARQACWMKPMTHLIQYPHSGWLDACGKLASWTWAQWHSAYLQFPATGIQSHNASGSRVAIIRYVADAKHFENGTGLWFRKKHLCRKERKWISQYKGFLQLVAAEAPLSSLLPAGLQERRVCVSCFVMNFGWILLEMEK